MTKRQQQIASLKRSTPNPGTFVHLASSTPPLEKETPVGVGVITTASLPSARSARVTLILLLLEPLS